MTRCCRMVASVHMSTRGTLTGIVLLIIQFRSRPILVLQSQSQLRTRHVSVCQPMWSFLTRDTRGQWREYFSLALSTETAKKRVHPMSRCHEPLSTCYACDQGKAKKRKKFLSVRSSGNPNDGVPVCAMRGMFSSRQFTDSRETRDPAYMSMWLRRM